MIKIIRLGYEVPQTGEDRVELLNDTMVKIASNEIQEYWAKLDKSPDKAYLHVIAMTDSNYYGCNNNGDFFYGKDLKEWHHTFVDNAHVFLHHVNKDPKKSIGKPIYSWYNENMHRVELVLELYKNNPLATKTIDSIKRGDQIYVSMGVSVTHDICSVCDNKAKTRKEYCSHLRYNMKKILPDGRQVYSINPPPLKFFDISVVNKPADKVAWALDKAASSGYSPDTDLDASSAQLGQVYEEEQACLAGLDKVSEIIKQVEGDAVDYKDDNGAINLLRSIPADQFKHLDYPIISGDDMDETGLSPGGLLRAILGSGAPPSFGEMALISGRHHMGSDFGDEMIPEITQMAKPMMKLMRRDPRQVLRKVQELLDDYRGELDDEDTTTKVIRIVVPKVRRRVVLLKEACGEEVLTKMANEAQEFYGPPEVSVPLRSGSGPIRAFQNAKLRDFSAAGPGMTDTFTVMDREGNEYLTDRSSAMVAQDSEDAASMIVKMVGAAAGLAALGAFHSQAPLMTKMLATPALTAVSASLLFGKSKSNDIRDAGDKDSIVPAGAVFQKKASRAQKVADASARAAATTAGLFGMAIPAGLGADYLINKHLKYRGVTDPKPYMGRLQRGIYRAGEQVADSPLTSLGTGAVVGGALAMALRRPREAAKAVKAVT